MGVNNQQDRGGLNLIAWRRDWGAEVDLWVGVKCVAGEKDSSTMYYAWITRILLSHKSGNGGVKKCVIVQSTAIEQNLQCTGLRSHYMQKG